MRILLTGTNGQVGGALLPLLGSQNGEGQGSVLAPNREAFDLSRPETLGETRQTVRRSTCRGRRRSVRRWMRSGPI